MSDSQTDPVLPGELEPELYDQLRDIAAYYLRGERPGHTLQPTELAHEAYIRMHPLDGRKYVDRRHFLAVAARVMRRVLVDHARARMADKRWGGVIRVTLTCDIAAPDDKRLVDILDIDAAITRLEAT
ncbi:MAG: RNA polymerase subunit sigma, partial [Candidatus Eisenbacteria bacterium]|nr:RNA polymerase subunit sigma [Candidatus Eisenbacteria bacterium]